MATLSTRRKQSLMQEILHPCGVLSNQGREVAMLLKKNIQRLFYLFIIIVWPVSTHATSDGYALKYGVYTLPLSLDPAWGATVSDQYTLRFDLTRPAPYFPETLITAGLPTPEAKNSKQAYFKTIQLQHYPKPNQAFFALTSAKKASYDRYSGGQLKVIEAEKSLIKVIPLGATTTDHLTINVQDKILKNRQIRQALSLALDRSDIVKALGYSYDLNQRLELELLVNKGDDNELLAELVRQQWGTIGIDLTVIRHSTAIHYGESLKKGHFQVVRIGWLAAYPAPPPVFWGYCAGKRKVILEGGIISSTPNSLISYYDNHCPQTTNKSFFNIGNYYSTRGTNYFNLQQNECGPTSSLVKNSKPETGQLSIVATLST